MRLPFLRPRDPSPTPPAAPPIGPAGGDAAVDAARRRARHRLLGALVLLVAGVVGFPLLFDTQPRPLAVDTPIEVVRKPPDAQPAATASAAAPSLPPADAGIELPAEAGAASAPPRAEPAGAAVVVPEAAVATIVVPGPAAPRAASAASPSRPENAASPSRPASASSAAVAPARAASRPGAADAKAAESTGGRFVVQAGAYADATRLREARVKVEKLGLKTYTQVVDTPGGPRTRLRVGPFATREQAQAAAAKVKAAGVQAGVVSL